MQHGHGRNLLKSQVHAKYYVHYTRTRFLGCAFKTCLLKLFMFLRRLTVKDHEVFSPLGVQAMAVHVNCKLLARVFLFIPLLKPVHIPKYRCLNSAIHCCIAENIVHENAESTSDPCSVWIHP